MIFSTFFVVKPAHEIGENTVVAQGFGLVAKVRLPLQQTLLRRGTL